MCGALGPKQADQALALLGSLAPAAAGAAHSQLGIS